MPDSGLKSGTGSEIICWLERKTMSSARQSIQTKHDKFSLHVKEIAHEEKEQKGKMFLLLSFDCSNEMCVCS